MDTLNHYFSSATVAPLPNNSRDSDSTHSHDTLSSHADSTTRDRSVSQSSVATNKSYQKELIDKGILEYDGTINATIENCEKLSTEEHIPKNYQKKDDSFWSQRKLSRVAYWYHIVCFGVCIIFSCTFTWNKGIALSGFPLYTLCFALNSIGFQMLAFAMAELCSGLPFSGGSFGFVRATIGMKTGMLVGVVESAEYIIGTAVSVVQCTAILNIIFGTDESYSLLWDLFLTIICTSIQLVGGTFYWNSILIGGIGSILGALIYVLSTAPNLGNFGTASVIQWSGGTVDSFMLGLPNSVFTYLGIECLPLCCEETHDSKEEVSYGLRWGMAFIIFTNVILYFTALSVAGDSFLDDDFPFTVGYALTWGLEINETNIRILLVFALVPVFAATYSIMFAYGRQMFAMSRSGLLPQILSLTSETGVPYVSQICGSILVFCICLLIRYYDSLSEYLENMFVLTACVNYIFQFVAYIIVVTKYDMLQRSYRCPLGIWVGIIGISIFSLDLIALLGWQEGMLYGVIINVVLCVLSLAYYYFVSDKLILSPEEQFAMFMLYSLKFAITKNEKNKKAKYIEDENEHKRRSSKASSYKSPGNH